MVKGIFRAQASLLAMGLSLGCVMGTRAQAEDARTPAAKSAAAAEHANRAGNAAKDKAAAGNAAKEKAQERAQAAAKRNAKAPPAVPPASMKAAERKTAFAKEKTGGSKTAGNKAPAKLNEASSKSDAQQEENKLRSELAQAKKFGVTDRRYRTALGHLAKLNYERGDFKDAVPLYKEAVADSKRALDDLKRKKAAKEEIAVETREYAEDLSDLADCYRGEERYGEAADAYKQALKLLDSIGTEDTLQRAAIESELADVYTSMNKYAEAEALYKTVLDRLERKQNAKEPDAKRLDAILVDTLQDYAILLNATKRTKEAEAILNEVRKSLHPYKSESTAHAD
ncbi:MAG TPA: tetratricopeptide repeat protein [Candidatus Obscuribacterales bacterium]